MRALVAVVLLTVVLAGCGGDSAEEEQPADHGGPGLARADVTRAGDERCAFDEELRQALPVVGFDGELGDYPAGFDQVILHVGDQDYADSADSTDLYDVRGVSQICRYSVGDDLVLEGYLYWFAPTAERGGLEDAEASTYALADVSSGSPGTSSGVGVNAPVPVRRPDVRAAVVGIRARGGDGASAALSITVDGYRPDPAAEPGSLSAESLSGPLPAEDQVVDLLGAIAEQLSAR